LVGSLPRPRRCRGVDAEEPPGEPPETGGLAFGLRWIGANAIVRAELLGVATLNLFNFVFVALFTLYATRSLHVPPATLGVVMGSAAVGTLVASRLTGRIAARIGVGPALIVGCATFAAPLILVPAAAGPHWLILAFLFTAELISGVGLVLLDILAGSIRAAVVPPPVRSRVSGAFILVNYGVRPIGALLAAVLGSSLGIRPTLWIGTVGALAALLFLIPSPIRTLADIPATAGADAEAGD
jgi:MFS family permease